jgi:hypothetical protein
VLHNTLRFDIQLAHVQPMIDDGDVSLEEIVNAIRSAIDRAVDESVGSGLDGIPIPGGMMSFPVKGSQMLHREQITYDLS